MNSRTMIFTFTLILLSIAMGQVEKVIIDSIVPDAGPLSGTLPLQS